jgi:hypothetical protein
MIPTGLPYLSLFSMKAGVFPWHEALVYGFAPLDRLFNDKVATRTDLSEQIRVLLSQGD